MVLIVNLRKRNDDRMCGQDRAAALRIYSWRKTRIESPHAYTPAAAAKPAKVVVIGCTLQPPVGSRSSSSGCTDTIDGDPLLASLTCCTFAFCVRPTPQEGPPIEVTSRNCDWTKLGQRHALSNSEKNYVILGFDYLKVTWCGTTCCISTTTVARRKTSIESRRPSEEY